MMAIHDDGGEQSIRSQLLLDVIPMTWEDGVGSIPQVGGNPRTRPHGGVDIGLLVAGSPASVAAQTRERLRCLAPGGGYVCGSSNSIPRSVPAANYRAMLDSIRTWRSCSPAA